MYRDTKHLRFDKHESIFKAMEKQNTLGRGSKTYFEISSFEKKSITFKIMKTLHNFCLEENFPKQDMDNIVLTGGSLNLGRLAEAVTV